MASEIGITPELGVIGQYPEYSGTKILIWSIRLHNMLKFYTPLMSDSHLAVVFYTGKEKLTTAEIISMSTYGNIYIQKALTKSLVGTIESIIVQFEEHLGFGNRSHHGASATERNKIDGYRITERCSLYYGGPQGSEMSSMNTHRRWELVENVKFLFGKTETSGSGLFSVNNYIPGFHQVKKKHCNTTEI